MNGVTRPQLYFMYTLVKRLVVLVTPLCTYHKNNVPMEGGGNLRRYTENLRTQLKILSKGRRRKRESDNRLWEQKGVK